MKWGGEKDLDSGGGRKSEHLVVRREWEGLSLAFQALESIWIWSPVAREEGQLPSLVFSRNRTGAKVLGAPGGRGL